MHLLLRFIINAIVLYLIAKFVPGFNHDIGAGTAIVAAIVFGLVNALIGPVLRLLTFPINWLTHGLFSIIINIILFWLTVLIAPNFRVTGEVNPFISYLIGAVIMMIVSTLLHQAWAPPAERSAAGMRR
jgi:putative membrane protein